MQILFYNRYIFLQITSYGQFIFYFFVLHLILLDLHVLNL